MSTILVVAEIQNGAVREASFELLAFAQKLEGDVKSLVIGQDVGGLAEDFAKKGGGTTYVADDAALANYNVDGYAAAIRAAMIGTSYCARATCRPVAPRTRRRSASPAN